jgi:hypothetical protein
MLSVLKVWSARVCADSSGNFSSDAYRLVAVHRNRGAAFNTEKIMNDPDRSTAPSHSGGTRPVHFVFSPSGAGGLRRALSQCGPSPEVVTLFDDLSFGPLDPERRAQWWQASFSNEDDDGEGLEGEIWRRRSRFWEVALSPDVAPVVWINRLSAQERTGLLSFVANTHGRPFKLIDVTDVLIQQPSGGQPATAVTIAQLLPHSFIEVLRRETSEVVVDTSWILTSLTEWQRLLAEDAILRIVDAEGHLISVAEDFFDAWLLRFVGEDWTRAARVVGDALGAYHRECHRRIGDLFPALRLHILAERSLVEVKGTLGALHDYSVRLLQRA